MNGKDGIVIKEWIDENGKKHKITRFTSLGRSKEAEYVEIRKGVWQKVYGSEKDLDPIEK